MGVKLAKRAAEVRVPQAGQSPVRPGSSRLAHNLSNRGEYLVALRHFAEAIAAFEQALSFSSAQLGPDHRYPGFR